MKKFALVLGLFASVSSFAGVIYSNTADLSTGTYNHKIWRAKIFKLATKVEVREIPGCIPGGEAGNICTETVVLERTPVLQVDVSYNDQFNQGEGSDQGFVTFYMDPADAGKKLSLSVKRAERTIQVVDVRNSKLCPINGESGEPAPGCIEHIVYKPAKTFVKEVTVNVE